MPVKFPEMWRRNYIHINMYWFMYFFIVSYVLIYHQTLNVRSVVCMLPLTCVEHNGSNLHGGVDVLDLRLQLLVAQNLLLPLRQDGLCPNEFLAEEFLKWFFSFMIFVRKMVDNIKVIFAMLWTVFITLQLCLRVESSFWWVLTFRG